MPPSDADGDADLSELEGMSYRCIDGCALCCLCQPELLPDEERRFRAEPRLAEGLSERHISPDVRGAAIRLQGAHGACHFLRGRRCVIYDDRPHYCRAFPFSVFSGWRVQVNANLSCRGIGLPGEDLRVAGEALLEGLRPHSVEKDLEASRKVFAEFSSNARGAKVSQSAQSLRASAEALMDEFVDEVGLSRMLTFGESGRVRQNSSAKEVARRARGMEPEADLHEVATALGTELFDLPDLSYLPVYLDEELVWKVFRFVGDEVVGHVLSEDGGVEEFSRTAPSEVPLLPMSVEGMAEFRRYLGIVNNRDCFLGHAAYLLDVDGYGHNLAQVYIGALANAATDLWWRASFLEALRGGAALGRSEVREGIVFYDMDLLDQPTIGAFL